MTTLPAITVFPLMTTWLSIWSHQPNPVFLLWSRLKKNKQLKILEQTCILTRGRMVGQVLQWHKLGVEERRRFEWVTAESVTPTRLDPNAGRWGFSLLVLFGRSMWAQKWYEELKGSLFKLYKCEHSFRKLWLEGLGWMTALSFLDGWYVDPIKIKTTDSKWSHWC